MHRIFQRVGLIVKANLEALLDKAEDPAATAAQMVREIEEAVHQAKTAAAKTAADAKRLERMRDRNLQDAEEWAQRAVLALQKEREDLAREAVNRETQLRKAAAGLGPQLDSLSARSAQMQEDVHALDLKLDEARMRARQLGMRQRAVESQRRVQLAQQQLEDGVKLGELDRLEDKMDGLEAEVDAWEAVGIDSLEAQFRELENASPEVEQRLRELRRAAEAEGSRSAA
jgi:phage shock protein A